MEVVTVVLIGVLFLTMIAHLFITCADTINTQRLYEKVDALDNDLANSMDKMIDILDKTIKSVCSESDSSLPKEIKLDLGSMMDFNNNQKDIIVEQQEPIVENEEIDHMNGDEGSPV